MDCRKFHKNLEDYLEDGLDFSGRFGMERHAQQCISCGKDMSNARRLRQMVHELDRVKAPANFESAVLNEIAKRKAVGRFAGLRRFWFYGFDLSATRKLALASSGLAVLAAAIFYLYPYLFNRVESRPASDPPLIVREPAKIDRKEHLLPVMTVAAAEPSRPSASPVRKSAKPAEAPLPEIEQIADQEVTDTDYVEFQMIGPDNLPVSFRWPNKPHARNEDYFIRNVSH